MFLQVMSAPEGQLGGPSGAQVALGSQFGGQNLVQVALGGQFEGQIGVQVALGGQVGRPKGAKLRLECGLEGVLAQNRLRHPKKPRSAPPTHCIDIVL